MLPPETLPPGDPPFKIISKSLRKQLNYKLPQLIVIFGFFTLHSQGLFWHSEWIWCLHLYAAWIQVKWMLKGGGYIGRLESILTNHSKWSDLYEPYTHFHLVQLWLARIPSNFPIQPIYSLFPITSASTCITFSHPEDGGSYVPPNRQHNTLLPNGKTQKTTIISITTVKIWNIYK